MLLPVLRRYPGYTLTTLLAEDAELLQLIKIEALAGDMPASEQVGGGDAE